MLVFSELKIIKVLVLIFKWLIYVNVGYKNSVKVYGIFFVKF